MQPEAELAPYARRVSTGRVHGCTLLETGAIRCWGADPEADLERTVDFGQAEAPDGSSFEGLASGAFHNCALADSGRPVCWGRDDFGQASPPETTYRELTGGAFHTCGIRADDGHIDCWGLGSDPDRQEVEAHGDDWLAALDADQAVPPDGTYVEVAAGSDHTCAVDEHGTVECWGRGSEADRDEGPRDVDQAVPPTDFSADRIFAGPGVTCAGSTDGRGICWGRDTGRMGLHRISDAPRRMVFGPEHFCEIKAGGDLRCEGNNDYGQSPSSRRLWQDIAVGLHHTCGLDRRGVVHCWGPGVVEPHNDTDRHQHAPAEVRFGQADPEIPWATNISVGARETCLRRADGGAMCWGGDGSVTQRFEEDVHAVEAGGRRICMLRSSSVDSRQHKLVCWRYTDGEPQRTETRSEDFASAGPIHDLEVGGAHQCVSTSPESWCWGRGDEPGRFEGPGDSQQAVMPEGHLDESGDMSLGESHTCSAGRDACWGDRSSGQSTVPEGSFSAISAGRNHTCGLSTDREDNRDRYADVGRAICWGMGSRPEASEGAEDYDQAVAPDGLFHTIRAGRNYTCALGADRGRATCWGANDAGQTMVGDSQFNLLDTATLAPEDRGAGWSCGITRLGEVECWGGDPRDLELGGEGTPDAGGASSAPGATELAVGTFHGCARTDEGDVRCWGYHGERTRPPADRLRALDAGDHYTCGIRRDGSLACWGAEEPDLVAFAASARGQSLGDTPSGRFRQVTVAASHACAVRFDGKIACWGNGKYGKTQPPEGTFRTVTAGKTHTCGLRENGTVDCWGIGDKDDDGRMARMADRSDFGQTRPPEEAFESIDAGRFHTCGVRTDDRRVVCWGLGARQDQSKRGEESDRNFDQSLPPEGRFRAVSAGTYHTCGIRESGEMACWGLGSRPNELEGEYTYDFDQASPPDGTFVDVEVSALTSCGLRDDGQIVCWGMGDRLRESERNFDKQLDYNQAVTPDGFVE
jgi:alpha-tubulin suppressor-like RCC1 family protein